MTTREIGNKGENAVCWYLRLRGYRILDRNYTIKGGEIDIVAYKHKTLHFVEVKTRKENSLTTGEEAITMAKRAHIIKTAKHYCATQHKKYESVKFDVAVVTHKNNRVSDIVYYKDAFKVR